MIVSNDESWHFSRSSASGPIPEGLDGYTCRGPNERVVVEDNDEKTELVPIENGQCPRRFGRPEQGTARRNKCYSRMEELIPTAIVAGVVVSLIVGPILAAVWRRRARRTFQPRLYLGEFVPCESVADIRKRKQVEAWHKLLHDAG